MGNQQDYGMRIYDGRIGRFLSVDPLTDYYPYYTPYQFAGNTPLQAIDLDGLEPAAAGKKAGEIVHEKSGQSWKWSGNTWVDNSQLDAVVVTAKKKSTGSFTEWYSKHSQQYDNQVDAYRAWQSNPLYHKGESKWDRMFRLMGSGSMEARRDYAAGGHHMYGGAGRVAKVAEIDPMTAEMSRPLTVPLASLSNEASAAGGLIPKGFSSYEQFATAGTELKIALEKAGLSYSSIGVRGSAVTNISSKGGAFRETALGGLKASDVDVFIELSKDIPIKASNNIPGFIHPAKLFQRFPSLMQWSQKWTKVLGREITPGAFKPGTFNDANIIKF